MIAEQRTMTSPTWLLQRLVGFLRAGQPRGAPATGYYPVLALMPRRITDDEIATLTADLLKTGAAAVTAIDIGVAICAAIGELPAPADVDRVVQRLLSKGWAPGELSMTGQPSQNELTTDHDTRTSTPRTT